MSTDLTWGDYSFPDFGPPHAASNSRPDGSSMNPTKRSFIFLGLKGITVCWGCLDSTARPQFHQISCVFSKGSPRYIASLREYGKWLPDVTGTSYDSRSGM